MSVRGTSKRYDKYKQKDAHKVVLDPLATSLQLYSKTISAIDDIILLFSTFPNSADIIH